MFRTEEEALDFIVKKESRKGSAGLINKHVDYSHGEMDIVYWRNKQWVYVEWKMHHTLRGHARAVHQIARALSHGVVDAGIYVSQRKDGSIVAERINIPQLRRDFPDYLRTRGCL